MEEGDAAAAPSATGTEPLSGTNKAIDYAQLERDVEEQTAIAKEVRPCRIFPFSLSPLLPSPALLRLPPQAST